MKHFPVQWSVSHEKIASNMLIFPINTHKHAVSFQYKCIKHADVDSNHLGFQRIRRISAAKTALV
jgi:hypothetical protein